MFRRKYGAHIRIYARGTTGSRSKALSLGGNFITLSTTAALTYIERLYPRTVTTGWVQSRNLLRRLRPLSTTYMSYYTYEIPFSRLSSHGYGNKLTCIGSMCIYKAWLCFLQNTTLHKQVSICDR